MNRNEIIRVALEEGFENSEYGLNCTPGMYAYNMGIVERFYRAAYAAGAAAEREECAKVCEEKAKETFSEHCQVWGNFFARAIRARGNV